ncbi:hypothetical protein [Prevotella histicola]|uniref:Fido domain-containing protein n=1 Tax=Prevotella histicola F0411 TaxID=857291 RepID=G6AG44_9BACT|nr:hypothetical protein [Prevotella histicola]EHG16374.1 hypothetical protein HMPREF9138_01071 [Prevotella histicola F0411]QUB85085.1 hypothetical protein J5A62_09245 [Prevotella histicola]
MSWKLYSNVEEKDTTLFHLVTKNHPFCDGYKQITASLFLYFMTNNEILYHVDTPKCNTYKTPVTFTLMLVESRTGKNAMVKVKDNLESY